MKLLSKKNFFVLGVALFFVFIFYSYLVAKERFTQFDFDTTVKLQDKIPGRFDLPFSFFSVLGSMEVTGIIWTLIFAVMLFKRFWLPAMGLLLLPLALAIEVFGKLFVHHPSPPYLFYRGVLEVKFPLSFTHTDYSYPSGHETRTAFLIVFLMSYFFFRRRDYFLGKVNSLILLKNWHIEAIIQLSLLGILAVMTVSRIYLGEHWSTDVIGGFLIGTSFGLFAGITIPTKRTAQED